MRNHKLNVFFGPDSIKEFLNPENCPPTPLVEIPPRLNPFHQSAVRIFAKLGYLTPLLNIKQLSVFNMLQEAEDLTRLNDGLTLVVAFNYGARQEIARAARRLALEVAAGRLAAEAISVELLGRHLDAPDLPDPDVIIRTSGEQRLSNFLLWQAAYSELIFVPINWPDFDRAALEEAIAEYRRRERRFGGLIAQTGS